MRSSAPRSGPRIGITLGDPAGVGPDIVVRALAAAAGGAGEVVIFGDRGILDAAAGRAGVPVPSGVVEVTTLGDLPPGRPQPSDEARVGAAQVAYLEAAVAAVRAGEIDALVTAPINKALCRAAGFAFPGHTEFLAERLGAPRVAMMLAGPHLRVVPATIHVAHTSVPALLADVLPDTILLTARALRDDFALPHPRIAVAALNPHAGEHGQFGDEEARL